jgi:ubiquinone/menaquinone biosynthesis C-methylase UbiE
MSPTRTSDDIRDVNTRYHDAAADEYDTKWGIDFGAKGQAQVLGKLRKALGGGALGPYPRILEIGAGTGYFSLNLLQAGVARQAVCTDISPGMLATLRANAGELGLEGRVETVRTDAEQLPLTSSSFDLVLGHAVLHHIPDLAQAFREFARVLRPGGVLAFAGEPSSLGDRIARLPKRGAFAASPLWRRAIGAQARVYESNGDTGGPGGDHGLEFAVDVHAFTPRDLESVARGAGFENVQVRGEELLANWFGWTNRVLEATAEPDDVPWLWRQYAYRGYLALQEVDRRLLERRLPPAIFYNLLVAARKPS